jgi:phosphoenolpyruvate-protein phosphotransferase
VDQAHDLHDPPTNSNPVSVDGATRTPGDGSVVLRGIAASPGVAGGPALVYRAASPSVSTGRAPVVDLVDIAGERERLRAAIATAAIELHALSRRVAAEIGAGEAGIFDAQALMLDDPTIGERAAELIERDRLDAVQALERAAEEQAALLAAMPDPLWQARAADVHDAARQALAHLQPQGAEKHSLSALIERAAEPVVVLVDDLAPSDTVQMRPDRVLAIALAHGGATAHAAILARALRIPAVAGLGDEVLDAVPAGETLIVDGTQGLVVLRPTPTELEQAREQTRQQVAQASAARTQAAAWRERSGQTRDGVAVKVLANVGSEAEARAAAESGAEGIGLLRTEFLFAERLTLPDAGQQAALYTALISVFGSPAAPITIRLLDAGADKPLPSLAGQVRALPAEANPALGVRGIRLQLAFEDLLDTQLRGIVLAAARTRAHLRVMVPMVATVGELRAVRTQLQAIRAQLSQSGLLADQPLPVGIMVETPAAVFTIESLAREAAFLSIGTNDLTQYVMAADRLNPRLATLCQPEQPPVLRAIATIAHEATRLDRHVGVCGEMAADPTLALLLVGLGVRELSMAPASIPAVKQALASRTLDELRTLAVRALEARTVDEVQRTIHDALDTPTT